MSFSKAKVKRFNDLDGNAPPSVGKSASYGRLSHDSSLITPSDRTNGITDDAVHPLPKAPTSIQSASKKNSRHSIKTSGKLRRTKSALQESEMEIRRLLQERSNLLKQMTTKDEEKKKVNSRLQVALRERSSFQASVASFEKENKELRRVNEILKVKVNTFEGSGRKKDVNMELANLRVLLVNKNHEISDLRHEIHTIREDHELEAITQAKKGHDVFKINCSLIEIIRNLKSELEHTREQVVKLLSDTTGSQIDGIAMRLRFLEEKMAYYQRTINEQIQLVEESSDQASCSQYETSTEKDDSVFKMEDLESISPFPEHCSQEDLHGKGSSFSSCSDFNESFIESRYDDQDKNLSEATKEELDKLTCELLLSELVSGVTEADNKEMRERLSHVHNSYINEKEKCESLQRQLVFKEEAAESEESRLKCKISELQEELKSLKRQLVLQEEAAAFKESELKRHITNAINMYQETVGEVVSLEKKIEDILSLDSSTFEDFESLLESKSTLIASLETQIQKSDVLHQSSSEFEEVEAKIVVLENEQVENQKKLDILLEQKRLFCEKLSYFEVFIEILVKCSKRRHLENIELLSALECKTEEVETIKKDLETTNCTLIALQDSNWDLEHQRDKLREEVVILEQKLLSALECKAAEVDAIKMDLETINCTLVALQDSNWNLENEREKLKEEVVVLQQKLFSALESKRVEVETIEKDLKVANCNLVALQDAKWNLEHQHEKLKEEVVTLQQKLSYQTMTITKTENIFQECSHELSIVKDTLKQEKELGATLRSIIEERNKRIDELSAQLQAAAAAKEDSGQRKDVIEDLTSESARWRNEYETLKEKIAPFQEQLDAYSMEREMLVSRNQETMDNLKSLSLQYATLLGHQNHKQKIHYMVNLKEENFSLKEEVAKLRSEALKLRTSIHKRDCPPTPVSAKKIAVHPGAHVGAGSKDGPASKLDL